ncbi:pseudouridine synthase family protein [Helicobacter ailurogastricus]|uniref:pseudouridine synthase family protein n=1 Tax=Helicobacter ailurogastricus TaxID=1578720 RepID=UPI00244D8A63|nr:RluA family pseudouridine synthase [Helicobacter ailurogastricus]GMB91266.1 Pseudouridine synthase RluD1 [Helicobacter ailurogastricus]
MPFIAEVFTPKAPIKAAKFVAQSLACSLKQAQSYIDRGRLTTLSGQRLKKAQILNEPVRLLFFKPTPKPESSPIFTTPYFAIYHKPKNLYSHPKNYTTHSLYESIYANNPHARLINRLDYETSGLVLTSQAKAHEKPLRELFSSRQVVKTYAALVQGDLRAYASGAFSVVLPIVEPSSIRGDLGVRSKISKQGKFSATTIEIQSYDPKADQTHLKVTPLTGRTHQIRLHLSALGYPLVGEPLYIEDNHARAYLDAKKADFLGAFGRYKTELALEAVGLSFSLYGLHYHLRLN